MRPLAAWIVGFAVVGAVALDPLAWWLTDLWWFDSIGQGDTFRRAWTASALAAVAAGAVAAVMVGGSARIAARYTRPARGGSRVLSWASPRRAADAVTAVVAFASAVAAGASWERILLFVHSRPFGWADPIWGLDASFYVFDLPLIRWLVQWLTGLSAASLVVSAATYVAAGALRVQLVQQDGQLVATGIVVPQPVRRHLGSLAAVLVVASGMALWLDRYTVLYAPRSLITGPGYADLYGTIPLASVGAVALLVAAAAMFYAMERGSLVGLASSAGLAALAWLLPVAVPPLLQQFVVDPNQLSREGPQIRHHLDATRYAWRLDGIEERTLGGGRELSRADIERSQATIDNVALWDHAPLLEALSQVQEIRTYYGFVSVDNDRYRLDGQLRQVMVSPRELTVEALQPEARTWVNETMVYTHGYGVAVGPVNEVTSQGLPELFLRDVPPRSSYPDVLRVDRPEIYFGEALTGAVVVGTDNEEFDYPKGDQNVYTRYQGADGVPIGRLGRWLFALRLGSTELLLSSDVDRESRILLYRNVLERARRVAPMLTFDADPYLVLHEGRMVWVLDAYTTSRTFPYAAAVHGFGSYARSTVKVTIDAYDGSLHFYRLPTEDPIIAAWDAAFPHLFEPLDAMPPGLRAHLRYPHDLFRAQAGLFASYHMAEPQVFYNREDAWEVPVVEDRIEPYYTIMRLPGEVEEEFVYMLPFSPRNKQNLAAWMVARSDGQRYGQLIVYKFPKDTMVYGPAQVRARVNQDDAISEKLSLWDQQGSRVRLGTVLVIPIEQSLLYVQPLYLQAESGSIPELKRVILSHQDRIVMTATLTEGLERLFADPAAPPPTAPGLVVPAVTSAELIRQAGLHWDAAQAALKQGDLATFAARLELLGPVIRSLQASVAPEPE